MSIENHDSKSSNQPEIIQPEGEFDIEYIDWLAEVDRELFEQSGKGYTDFLNFDFHSFYEKGVAPMQVATQLIQQPHNP